MAKKLYEESNIAAIAEMIREKTGSDTKFKVSEMPAGIESAHHTGYDEGRDDGYNIGYDIGYSEGSVEGKQEMRSAMWKGIQQGGTRTDYTNEFKGEYWDDETFAPEYSFAVASGGKAGYMFQKSNIEDAAYIYGDKLDFSNYVNLLSLFASSKVKRLKRIDARGTQSGWNGQANICLSCHQLETVEEFYPSVNAGFTGTFMECENLTHIIFCSEIAQNGLNLSACKKLDRASINSIFDYMSSTTSGLTIILSKAAVDAALYDEATQTPGSETLNWEYFYEGRRSNWTIKLI